MPSALGGVITDANVDTLCTQLLGLFQHTDAVVCPLVDKNVTVKSKFHVPVGYLTILGHVWFFRSQPRRPVPARQDWVAATGPATC